METDPVAPGGWNTATRPSSQNVHPTFRALSLHRRVILFTFYAGFVQTIQYPKTTIASVDSRHVRTVAMRGTWFEGVYRSTPAASKITRFELSCKVLSDWWSWASKSEKKKNKDLKIIKRSWMCSSSLTSRTPYNPLRSSHCIFNLTSEILINEILCNYCFHWPETAQQLAIL